MAVLVLVWVAIAVLALALIGLLILAVPVELTFRVARGDDTRPDVSVRWLFGLVHRDLGASEKDAPEKPDKKEDEPGRQSARAFIAMLQSGALFRLIGFGWRLFRKIELKEFVLRGRFGTGDPGQTGILYGVSSAFTAPANRRRNIDIRLSPSYVEPVLEGEIHGTIRLVPIRLLPPLVGFFIRPSNISALRQLRKASA